MHDAPPGPLLVACLCAQWCGVCREYRPAFEHAQSTLAQTARFAWIDIEDHPDVPGEIDVENFPTLLIARNGAVLFYGAVTPHAATLTRLVLSAAAGNLAESRDGELRQLAVRAAAHAGTV